MARDALTDDLQLALELADIADRITLSRYRANDLQVESKPDMTPVSDADKAVERALRDRLAPTRPDDLIVGEEFGGIEQWQAHIGRAWIIDPIDGTKSYVRGMDTWSTLIALTDQHEVKTAVVSMPELGKRWWASAGQGAFAATRSPGPESSGGGAVRQIKVSAVHEIADAQLCWSGIRAWDEVGGLDRLVHLARACWRTRGIGDAWQYMLVAEGAAEFATDPEVSLWDLAAVSLIVTEAGGTFTALDGTPGPAGGSALASNGVLHEQALALLGG